MDRKALNILIVAGEASGDTHAAGLVRELKNLLPENELRFFGATGHALRDAGVEQTVNADQLSVVGVLEIARVIPMFWRAFAALLESAVSRRADLAVLVDFPEFNLKLARALSRRGIPVVYYISPQVWAWRSYRVGAVRRYVDLLLTILPFEKQWYADRGVHNVAYVGNPTVREIRASKPRAEVFSELGLDPDRPLVALLPGSRHKEIVRILPVLLDSAELMLGTRPDLQFAVCLAKNRPRSEVADALEARGGFPGRLAVAEAMTHDVVAASDAAAVTSGTATLETGVLGTPMTIVYKTSAINAGLFRPLIRVEHFGLINLVAGERIATELIQDDFTPEALAGEILSLLDPDRNAAMRSRLRSAVAALGEGGASRRAAEEIKSLLAARSIIGG